MAGAGEGFGEAGSVIRLRLRRPPAPAGALRHSGSTHNWLSHRGSYRGGPAMARHRRIVSAALLPAGLLCLSLLTSPVGARERRGGRGAGGLAFAAEPGPGPAPPPGPRPPPPAHDRVPPPPPPRRHP